MADMTTRKKTGTKTAEPKNKGGRPSDYRPEYDAEAEDLYRNGKTDDEVAEYFGVPRSTLLRWVKQNQGFRYARKAGKDADMNVERSLYQRAMGYSHPDTHISNFKGEITETPITKHYPPDTTACIFWLKNRQRDKWRDKIEADVGGDINVNIVRFTDADDNPSE